MPELTIPHNLVALVLRLILRMFQFSEEMGLGEEQAVYFVEAARLRL